MLEGGKGNWWTTFTNWSKSPSTAEGQTVACPSRKSIVCLPVGFLTRVPGPNLIMSEHQTGTEGPQGMQGVTLSLPLL